MKPVAENVKFPEVELEVLQFWDDNKIFEKTLEKTRDQQPFIFYDGPPVCHWFAALWPSAGRDDQRHYSAFLDHARSLCRPPLWLGLPWPAG